VHKKRKKIVLVIVRGEKSSYENVSNFKILPRSSCLNLQNKLGLIFICRFRRRVKFIKTNVDT
jgi:hypothetical protein